jgi:aspartate/methionine/tyrosine aminotransferase
VFCSKSPLQEAAAAGLEQAAERQFFETQVKEYQERRDLFVSAFDRLGVTYSLPEGTYFVLMVCPKCLDNDHLCYNLYRRTHPGLKSPMIIPFQKAF